MDEEDEGADAGEVGRPRHHHQQDRRHVVDEHLPVKEEGEIQGGPSACGLGYVDVSSVP